SALWSVLALLTSALSVMRATPTTTLFPYTTLFRSVQQLKGKINASTVIVEKGETIYGIAVKNNTTVSALYELNPGLQQNGLKVGDRKSTRLNSSHVKISYAVCCLKKKTADTMRVTR